MIVKQITLVPKMLLLISVMLISVGGNAMLTEKRDTPALHEMEMNLDPFKQLEAVVNAKKGDSGKGILKSRDRDNSAEIDILECTNGQSKRMIFKKPFEIKMTKDKCKDKNGNTVNLYYAKQK